MPGFKEFGVVVFVETLKAVLNRVLLCLRSRIGISNYVSYNRDSRKRERPPFTMTLQFEFDRKRLYVITHDHPGGCRADLCRNGLEKCDTGIDNVPTLQSNASPKCEGFVVLADVMAGVVVM